MLLSFLLILLDMDHQLLLMVCALFYNSVNYKSFIVGIIPTVTSTSSVVPTSVSSSGLYN